MADRRGPSLPVKTLGNRVAYAALVLVLLSLACTPCNGEDFYKGTEVVELTASSFRNKLLESSKIWMVEFYAPWCGHCQRLKPDYIKAATSSKGVVGFAAINCDEHKSIAGEFGIKGFPTLKIFGLNKKKPQDYQGPRTPKAMADALIALLPNLVTILTAKQHDAFVSEKPAVPKAVLFTAKASTSALYKSLALDLKDRMLLGEVRAKKEGSLLERYSVREDELPKLLVLPREGGGEEPVVYQGDLKHKPLLEFLNTHAIPKPGKSEKGAAKEAKKDKAKGEGERPAAPEKAAAKPKVVEVAEVRAAADMEELCVRGPGFCVLGLLAGDVDGQRASFQAVAAKYASKDPFKFAWVDASQRTALSDVFASPQGAAAVAIINAKRGKFALQEGLDNLEAVLDRALGGDLSMPHQLQSSWHSVMDQ